jgi:hypothetical protein
MKGSTIQCELQEVNFVDDWPSYNALSYVWGDPHVTQGIQVHGSELQITSNLESALQSLRLCDSSRILWIDAICIDQGNLTERSEQIQNMVQIYSHATSVLIWLGNDDSVHHAFNIIENLYQSCHKEEETKEAPALETAHQPAPSPLAALLNGKTINHNLERLVNNLTEDDYMHLRAAFMDNSWWSRAWVLQEVFHAHKVSVICARHSMSWNVVSTVIKGISGGDGTIRLGYTLQYVIKIWFWKMYQAEMPGDLGYVIQLYKDKYCTDPRDHIFALLSLSDGGCSIRPDYTKIVSRVFLESTTAMIKTSKRLDVICLGYSPEFLSVSRTDRRSDEIIPSWVPDWSSPHRFAETYPLIREGYFKASLGRTISDTLPDTFPSKWPWLMRLRGVMFDRIATTFPKIATVSPDWKSEVLAWLPEILNRVEYPTGEVVFDVVWRTLLKDMSRDAITKYVGCRIPEKEKHWYRELFHHWCEDKIDLANMGEAESVATLNKICHFDGIPDIQVFEESLTTSLNECIVFITERGYIGLTVGSVKLGDRICVVSGAPIPLLLRYEGQQFRGLRAPTGVDGWHTLAGASYVHGIMDGEVMERAEFKNEGIFLI